MCQRPFPNCHNSWNIIRIIQNIRSNMIFIKLIIKNYLPWVTSYYMTTCNKEPNIVHKFTFHTLLTTPIFWQDVRVLSFVFIINSLVLYFTISFFIPPFIHRIKRTSSHIAIIIIIIRNITHLSIELILRNTIHCIVNFLINVKSFRS